MRTRFDVLFRWWSKKNLVLEDLAEVQAASERVLGMLGPRASRGGGR